MPVKPRTTIALALCLVLFSCGRLGSRNIDLPSTPLLSGGPGWALVTSSYVRVKDAPGAAAADLAAIRDGTLLELLGRDFAPKDGSLWYHVKTASAESGSAAVRAASSDVVEGWVPENAVDVFASRAQAESALASRSNK
jgi:hypothetical protein